jgi:hypothetical protein
MVVKNSDSGRLLQLDAQEAEQLILTKEWSKATKKDISEFEKFYGIKLESNDSDVSQEEIKPEIIEENGNIETILN